jgi:predicted anti-sigma-YlaC factor YlaD
MGFHSYYRLLVTGALLVLLNVSCSLKKKAVNTLADVLGEAEGVYLSDEDPELIAAALPFNLKTLETLLQSTPEHRGLLLTATKSFVFYAYGFVQPEADLIEDNDFVRAQEIRERAAKLYLRAYQYGLRGLEVDHPGFAEMLPLEPTDAVLRLKHDDVPLAVWTAAALGSAVAASADDAEVTADIAVVGALLHRALELEESFEQGTIHEFLVSYEAQTITGSTERAQQHFQRALALSAGRRVGIWLTWAESFSIAQQNREEFAELMQKVIDFDIDSAPENRLLNILAQRRARWLKGRIHELFL